MGGSKQRGRHTRNASDELHVAELEEFYEDVYEQQRGSGKRDSGRTLRGGAVSDANDGLLRQKSGRRTRKSAQPSLSEV